MVEEVAKSFFLWSVTVEVMGLMVEIHNGRLTVRLNKDVDENLKKNVANSKNLTSSLAEVT